MFGVDIWSFINRMLFSSFLSAIISGSYETIMVVDCLVGNISES